MSEMTAAHMAYCISLDSHSARIHQLSIIKCWAQEKLTAKEVGGDHMHLVSRLSKVGGDASHRSSRVVAPVVMGVVAAGCMSTIQFGDLGFPQKIFLNIMIKSVDFGAFHICQELNTS